MVQVRPDAIAAAPAALDLHEGLCAEPAPAEIPGLDGRYSDPRRGGCARWPSHLWLVSSHGERVPGRCKATNQCDYCAKLAAIENTEMLALDAMEGDAPQVWCVLTTSIATLDMSIFYDARRQLVRELRRRLGRQLEYASLLEFTTGYGPWSGGLRRPHWNVLLKGVLVDQLDVVRQVVEEVWCRCVGSDPAAQHVAAIAEAGGLMRYIALHFQKESQSPPAGFTGQRFNCSRGYFTGRTRAEAREDARLALGEKRALWKLERHTGLTGDALEDAYEAQLAAEGFAEWGLYSEKRPDVAPNLDPQPSQPVAAAVSAWQVADPRARELGSRWGLPVDAIDPAVIAMLEAGAPEPAQPPPCAAEDPDPALF